MPLAVVTGCNKGVGYYIAQRLRAAGVDVIAACRNPELGRAAAKELAATYEPLDLSSETSIDAFAETMKSKYGSLDILVNNGAIAFKARDPTPFAGQTLPTFKTNYWGTVRLTDRLLPLLRDTAAQQGQPGKVVNVASMAGKLGQVSGPLQAEFASKDLTRGKLDALVLKFEQAAQAGIHKREGFSNSNYGMSKLSLIAYTMMVAREEGQLLQVNCCCPGWCNTDMSSHSGPRHPNDGAANAAMLALLPPNGPTGVFVQNEKISRW